jgi:dolichol kinase
MNPTFWLSTGIQFLIYGFVAYAAGLLVERMNVKVNYTRKIDFFVLFVTPLVFHRFFPQDQTVGIVAVRFLLVLAIFLILIKPIRERVPAFMTMFRSFDRPEDRPHTLLWFSTQIIVGYAVLIPMSIVFTRRGFHELMFIPVLIHGIGDGLAEPVGIRFGRHKYTTRAFLSKERRYTRSYEGSACVFIVGLLSVVLFYSSFTTPQFFVALLAVPLLTTVAEATAPHTWDTPYIFLAAGLSTFAVKMWV